MTLQYAKELMLMEITQVIDAKNKRIEELEIENSMMRLTLEQMQSSTPLSTPFTESVNLAEIEDKMIREALKRNNNNRKKTAQDLGISERTLYRKVNDLGIKV